MITKQRTNDVDMQQLAPQPVLSIRAAVQLAALGEVQDEMLRTLSNYLQQSGAKYAGPPFVRYHTFEATETDLELGVPVLEPAAGEGRVTAGSLPIGPAITTWHLGSHDKLADAYGRMQG